MTNFKKDYDLFIKSAKEPSKLIKNLSVINSVLECELKADYEALIKRSMTNSEINQICQFVCDYDSNLDDSVIIYNLFRLFTETNDFDDATSTRTAQFRIKDLKDPDRTEQIYNTITDLIMDCSSDYDYLFNI